MKKSYKTLLLAGLVTTSVKAASTKEVMNQNEDSNSNKMKLNKNTNHFVEVDGYQKLITDDEAINELDLEAVKVKLMDKEDGPGWTLEQADLYAEKYRAFLYLNKKYPDKKIVPSKEVDEVWHTHILDTYKYHDDSQKIFGHYLHHFPYFGMRNEADREDLDSSFKETLDIYRKEFPATFSKKVINQSALCIGEKPGKCAWKQETVKSALCIGEKPGKCAWKQETVKSALCIGEKPGKCAWKQESIIENNGQRDDESAETFQNRIRPKIDRSTGLAVYEE